MRGSGARSRFMHILLVFVLSFSVVPALAVGVTPAPAVRLGGAPIKAPQGVPVDAAGHPYVEGEVLVKFSAGVSATSVSEAHKKLGATVIAKSEGVPGLQKARVPKGLSADAAARRYREMPGVAYAQPNYLHSITAMPDDPRLPELWGMNNEGQTGGLEDADIDAPAAWDTQTGSSDVVVAVIDTGVDYRHPDLADNMWVNAGEIAGNGIDDDENGYVDDVYGYDFYNYDGDPLDDHSHGTHCSGTIGGVGDNGIGVAGVAWDVRIMALKFLSADGFGDTWAAVEAINYADMMGADIMSNSWGGGPWEQVLYDAIANTDVLFVAAAGNDSMDADSFGFYPSGYDLPNIVSVGATDHNDELAWFSNWGQTTVDVFAPGDEVLSTVAGPAPSFMPKVTNQLSVSACDNAADWDLTSYVKLPWKVSSDWYSSEPAALVAMQYKNDEDAWARLNAPVDLSGMTDPVLRFQAIYETEAGFDFLNAWASNDGVAWTKVAERSGYSGGMVTVDADLGAFAGDSTVYLAFSLSSDDSIDSKFGHLGAMVDDVEVVELASFLREDFSDLSAWDADDYAVTPWALTSKWVVSAPSAAGVIGYGDNERSLLKLADPMDLSAVTGDISALFKAFYETEPNVDFLSVLASTDGTNWTTLSSFSGFSGEWEPGFVPVSANLSAYAGEPSVYLAFMFESDMSVSSDVGLTGVAVDDLTVVEGTWSEADYSDAYALFSGTSMATPHVSGIAALVLSQWPDATTADLKNAIMLSADKLPQLDGRCVSGGRANAAAALGDVFAPVVTDDNAGSYTGVAEIALTATDDSGVASISYAFDGASPTTVGEASTVAIMKIPAKSHTLTYWAEDTLGNVSEPVTVEFELLRGTPRSESVAGSNRYATSVAASQKSYPDGASTVVIATGRNWPDALGGTALAGVVDGPILLTDPARMPAVVLAEVERLDPSRVYVLGSQSAVGSYVIGQIMDTITSGTLTRLSGANRYETAEAIAAEVIALSPEYDGTVLVATGANYPDALAAAPLAAHKGWPVVLANPSGATDIPEEASSAVILGGPGAVSSSMEAALRGRLGEANVQRKGGVDRYETAAIVAAYGISNGLHWDGVGIATGVSFADALSGGVMLGRQHSPMLLTDPNVLSAAVRGPLWVNKKSIQTVQFIGGTSAVSTAVRSQVMRAIQ
ncbi:MAG: hypothetical protein D9V44_01435 [Actinobacteria bacterium]|nr:MAG: hypothetical protein D9V44_01435 [Actinomycetota bacterium]